MLYNRTTSELEIRAIHSTGHVLDDVEASYDWVSERAIQIYKDPRKGDAFPYVVFHNARYDIVEIHPLRVIKVVPVFLPVLHGFFRKG